MFTLLVIVSRVVMYHATWPSRSYLLMVAAKLGFAWLAIRLVTSVLRNRLHRQAGVDHRWFVAALSILGQLDSTFDLLDSVAIVLGGLRLTPLLVIKAGALLLIALCSTTSPANFAESRINATSDLTPSVQVLLVKIIRIGLLTVAIVIALGSGRHRPLGARGVLRRGRRRHRYRPAEDRRQFHLGHHPPGDKSVKPGDLVTIGDNTGRISAMKTRYISVAAGDGREFLVPNEDL